MELSDIQHNISESVHEGKLSNEDLVQIIELAGSYLNLQTISVYSKEKGISYNGAKNNRQVETIFGCKFVIDNE